MIQHEFGSHGIILCMKFNAIERIKCACISHTHLQARIQHTRKQSSNIFYTFIMKLRANPVIKFKANRIIAAPNKFASIILHFSLTLVRLQFNPHVESIFVVVVWCQTTTPPPPPSLQQPLFFVPPSFACLPACRWMDGCCFSEMFSLYLSTVVFSSNGSAKISFDSLFRNENKRNEMLFNYNKRRPHNKKN